MSQLYTLQGEELGSLLSAAIQKARLSKAVSTKAIVSKLKPPPVKIIPKTPKISIPPQKLKVTPQEIAKTGQGLQTAGNITTTAGKGIVAVGGAVASTGVGLKVGTLIAGAGGAVAGAGSFMTASGTLLSSVGGTATDIQKLSKLNLNSLGTKEGLALVSKVGTETDSNLLNKSPVKIGDLVNTGNQAISINDSFKAGNLQAGSNLTSDLLNNFGVNPTITESIRTGGQIAQQGKEGNISETLNTTGNFLSSLGYNQEGEIFKMASGTTSAVERILVQENQKGEILPNPFPVFKDPVNDPSHPLYIPPISEPSKGKPIPLPSNQKTEKTDSSNIGIFLIAGIGIFLLTQKKGKKK